VVDLAAYEVCVDWKNNGDFVDAEEDISADVRELVWSRGRDQELNKVDTGRCRVTVVDLDGKYIPENTGSVLFPDALPGRAVRVRATHNLMTYDLFRGVLDDLLPEPRLTERRAVLPCLDGLDKLARDKITMALQKIKLSGELFTEALDKVGWDAGRRVLDTGIDTYPLVFTERGYCRNFLDNIALSEFGFFYVDGRGYLCWEDRHHRLKVPHTVSQWTCSADKYIDLEPMDPIKGVRNVIIIEAQPYIANAAVVELWRLQENKDNVVPDSPVLRPGESYDYWAKFSGIADNVITPAATTDYLGNVAIDGSGVDKTAQLAVGATKYAQSTKITVTNNDAGNVYLTMLKIRGELYDKPQRLEIVDQDGPGAGTSIARFGERHLPISLPYYLSAQVMRDTAAWQLATKKDPWASYRVHLIGDTNEVLEQILLRKLSDRITLQSADFNINADYYIDKMEHHVREDGLHECRWTLTRADDQFYWVIGVSTIGETTRLGF